jgi:ATP-dependent Clp protease, protease subunit
VADVDEPFWLRARLHDQRMVMLRGPLDDSMASRVVAELLVLDGDSTDAIQLQVDSSGGPLEAAFAVIDTVDALRAAVEVTCVGRAEGSAVGVVASAPRRLAAPHARFRLCEPSTTIEGRASVVEAWAEHHRAQVASFAARLAAATGRRIEHVEADLSMGRWLDADTAVAYGLVDEVRRPGPGRPDRPLGFR